MPQADYAVHYQPLFTALQTMDVQALIDQVEEPWYNQTLIQVGVGAAGSRAGRVPLARTR